MYQSGPFLEVVRSKYYPVRVFHKWGRSKNDRSGPFLDRMQSKYCVIFTFHSCFRLVRSSPVQSGLVRFCPKRPCQVWSTAGFYLERSHNMSSGQYLVNAIHPRQFVFLISIGLSCPVRSGPVKSGPVWSGPVRSGPVRSGPVRSVFSSGPVPWVPVCDILRFGSKKSLRSRNNSICTVRSGSCTSLIYTP